MGWDTKITSRFPRQALAPVRHQHRAARVTTALAAQPTPLLAYSTGRQPTPFGGVEAELQPETIFTTLVTSIPYKPLLDE